MYNVPWAKNSWIRETTVWSINDGAAKGPPETRLWRFPTVFPQKKDQISGIFSPRLPLYRAATSLTDHRLCRDRLNTHLISDVEDFCWNSFSWGSWDSKNFFRLFTVCVRATAACCDDNRLFSVAWNMVGIQEFTNNFDDARLFLCMFISKWHFIKILSHWLKANFLHATHS